MIDPRITEAIASFPATFRLRHYANTFRIAPANQQTITEDELLRLKIQCPDGAGSWIDFANPYLAELTDQMTPAEEPAATHTVVTDEELAEELAALSPQDRAAVDALPSVDDEPTHPADAPVLADLKAEALLEAAAEAQTKFWDLLGELEEALGGIAIESTKDLSGETVESLMEDEDDEDEDENVAVCNMEGCHTEVTADEPYFATPCGTYCQEHMQEHVEVCGICAAEFADDFEDDEEEEEDDEDEDDDDGLTPTERHELRTGRTDVDDTPSLDMPEGYGS